MMRARMRKTRPANTLRLRHGHAVAVVMAVAVAGARQGDLRGGSLLHLLSGQLHHLLHLHRVPKVSSLLLGVLHHALRHFLLQLVQHFLAFTSRILAQLLSLKVTVTLTYYTFVHFYFECCFEASVQLVPA